MIGINESNKNIKNVLKLHTEYVGSQVKQNIGFYKDLYSLMLDSKVGKMKNSLFGEKILQIKKKHFTENYKSLLNHVLHPSKKITSQGNITNAKMLKHWTIESTANISHTIKALNKLDKSYRALLSSPIFDELHYKTYQKISRSCQGALFLFSKIFDYGWFEKIAPSATWGPYQLTKAIGMSSCPYCNSQYALTIVHINRKKISRPQIDHFFPQHKHPLLALSFFNLIPSCSNCNSSIKGATNIGVSSLLNPYASNSAHNLMKFTFYPSDYESIVGKGQNLVIDIRYNGKKTSTSVKNKVDGNIKLFCLKEVYANHCDIVQELILKKELYTSSYIRTTQKAFKKMNLTDEDQYRIVFGNYFAEDDFHRRPLSKLTRDIAEELGISINLIK